MSTHQEKTKQVLSKAEDLLAIMNGVSLFYTHYKNDKHFEETIKNIKEIIEVLRTGQLSHDDLSFYDAWVNGLKKACVLCTHM